VPLHLAAGLRAARSGTPDAIIREIGAVDRSCIVKLIEPRDRARTYYRPRRRGADAGAVTTCGRNATELAPRLSPVQLSENRTWPG
jgi:hypothetical protein